MLGIVATSSRRAFGVDATQTPSGLPTGEEEGYSRVDFYLKQITDLYDQLADLGVSYWVTGGVYAKQKVFDTVTDLGGNLITRLHSDANLRYLQATATHRSANGWTRQTETVRWQNRLERPPELVKRFGEVGRLPDQPEVRILTTVANSPHLPTVLTSGATFESCS